jgi:hypothetical protein
VGKGRKEIVKRLLLLKDKLFPQGAAKFNFSRSISPSREDMSRVDKLQPSAQATSRWPVYR